MLKKLMEKGVDYIKESRKINLLLTRFFPFVFAFLLCFIFLLRIDNMIDLSMDASDIWMTVKSYYKEDTYASYVLYKGIFSVYPYVWLYQFTLLLGVGEFFFIKVFHSLLFAYIVGVGFPYIFEFILGRKIPTWKKIIYIVIIFWLQINNLAYIQIVIDLPYLFWFTLMIHSYLKLKSQSSKHKILIYMLLGAAIGCCTCFTGQYKFSAILILILVGYDLIKQLRKSDLYRWIGSIFIIVVMVGGVVMAEHAFQTRVVDGFRQEGAWIPTADDWVQNFLRQEKPKSAAVYLKGGQIIDYQITAIHANEEPEYEGLLGTMEIFAEYIRVGLKHPAELVISYANKFFLAFLCGNTCNFFYIFAHYSLLFIGIWTIKCRKCLNKQNLGIFISILVSILVPCVTHMESRYAMALQNFVYGFAILDSRLISEIKIGILRLKRKNQKDKLLVNQWTGWTTFLYLCFIIMCMMLVSSFMVSCGLENGTWYLFEY